MKIVFSGMDNKRPFPCFNSLENDWTNVGFAFAWGLLLCITLLAWFLFAFLKFVEYYD